MVENWKNDSLSKTELSKLNNELKREVADRKKAEMQLEQRNKLLSTLLDVSNLVSSTMELQPLLEAILDRLSTIIEYADARIFIIEEEYLRVIAHRSVLTHELESSYTFSVRHEPIGKAMIFDKEPVIIPDIMADTMMANAFRNTLGDSHYTIFEHVRSWIGIPLMVRDRVVGILTMDHSEPGYYNPRHVELGMAFANQVAIEFENARLYNETLQRADELKTMFAVQQAITSRLELKAVLNLIADEARRLTNSTRTAVFLVEGDSLVLSVFSGTDSSEYLGYRMSLDTSLAGRHLLSEKTLMVNDAQNDPEAYPGLVERLGIKSFLSIPLLAGRKAIGIIAVADKISGKYKDDDERILKMLGSVAVIGIENARLYEDEKRRHMEDEQRRRVAEGLKDILAKLNSNRPLAEIQDFIINQAVRLMNTNAGALYRLQKEDGMLTIEAAVGLPQGYVENMSIPMGLGVVGRAVKERKAIGIPNLISMIPQELWTDEKRGKHLQWIVKKYRGLLAVPLFCKDETYGSIALYYPEERDFSKEETDLAMTFADQAALAIDNARLRAQAEEIAVAAERSRLARDLHDAVTQTLFSASLIAEVLPKIWQKNPGEVLKRLEELRQLSRGALAEMRTLLLELRPNTLAESNLTDLLKQLTEAVTGRGRIPISLHMEGQVELPCDVKISLYRIAQEALNNIIKHSGASQVDIRLVAKRNSCTRYEEVDLCIQDNGRGFDRKRVLPKNLGLNIMQERAQAMDAVIRIDSEPGQGTVVAVKWSRCGEGKKNG